MSGFRARDADRDRYIDILESAYVDGQLGEQDRELRVSRALTAETLDELDALTRDLQNRPAPVVVHRTPAPQAVAPPPAKPPLAPAWPVPPARSSALPKLVVGAVAGVSVLAVLAMANPAPDEMEPLFGEDYSGQFNQIDQIDRVPEPGFRMGSRDVRELVDAYEARFGTIEAYQVSFFPRRAVVQVPVAGARPRFEHWTWDGEWTKDADAALLAAPRGTVDLGKLGAARLIDNIGTATDALRVQRGRFTRAVLARPADGPVDAPAEVTIHVGNEFNEAGSLSTTPNGKILRRQPFRG